MSDARLIGYIDKQAVALNGSLLNAQGVTGEVLSNYGVLGGIATDTQSMTGTISANYSGSKISGTIASSREVTGSLATAYTTGVPPYEGSYEITPKVEEQILETKQKYMTDDMTVRAIPYFDVSNTAGGSTVYIGSEV